MVPVRLGQIVSQLGIWYWGCLLAQVYASLIQGNRVKGSCHADIWQDSGIILAMAIAVWRNIHHQVNMEARPVLHHSLGVLCHFLVQKIPCIPLLVADSIKAAGTNTAAAALADILVNNSLVVHIGDGIRATLLGTTAATPTLFLIYHILAGGMLLHLAGTTAAAHANILDSSAKASALMALEVSQADEHICIHNGTANLCRLADFTILYRHLHIVGSLQSIANNDLTAGGNTVKAVDIGTFNMLQGVLAAAWIKGVAVCQKRQSPLLFYQIRNSLGIVWPQEGKIPQLPKMHFDGHKLLVKINILDTCCDAQTLHLDGPAGANLGTKICKINLGLFYGNTSLENTIH